MAHFTDQDRKRREFLKASGFTDREITDDLGKHKSSVLRELINRSIGCTLRCFETCPDFVERTCEKLLVMSHVNSYSRSVLDGGTAYDAFVGRFGEEGKAFLDRLGIMKIEPNEVTLDPILLGEKFKRHADRVIMRKAGVIATKQQTYAAKK